MKTRFFNYLRFTRAERNGTLVLFALAVLFFSFPEFTRRFRPKPVTDFAPFQQEIGHYRKVLVFNAKALSKTQNSLFYFDPNSASFDDFVRLGLSEKVANIICNYREKGGDFREPADFQKIWSLGKSDYERLLPYIQIEPAQAMRHEDAPLKQAAELFTFDPNMASEEDLLRLGLPPRTVKSILNYRSKGGQFRRKEDLEKIYTLHEADYSRIAPYATFLSASASSVPKPPVYAGGFVRSPGKGSFTGFLDINQASEAAWMTLPGIGETRARQLVSYREKLGGYCSVEQLGELHGLPDSVFQRIKPNLAVSAADIRKINLNNATVAELDAHPYISKRQAERIIAFREQHGAYSSTQELGKIRAFSDKVWLSKVEPYLGVE